MKLAGLSIILPSDPPLGTFLKIIPEEKFTLVNIPEGSYVLCGNIKILGSFIILENSQVDLVAAPGKKWFITTSYGPIYITEFDEIKDPTRWERFLSSVKRFFGRK